ncbi:MAG: Nif3-like dinuclear metal center hexameric protein [Abditibacteriota bacterium]|nr:Nif3-like dinuclear metal center hexameric protein [Abditibacteriota bacterium]
MLIRDLLSVLDGAAPFSLAEEWDNSGLLLGDPERELRGAVFCVDLVPGALALALENGANCIVCHHPYIFEPLRRLDFSEGKNRLLERLIKRGVALIACHTNLDSAPGGINDVLAELFSLKETAPIIPSPLFPGAGQGRLGKTDPVSSGELLKKAEEIFGVPPRHNGVEKTVRAIALCGGSGADICLSAKADCVITSEIKRHMFAAAALEGTLLIDGGHFETELPGTRAFCERIKSLVPVPVSMYEAPF